MKKIVNFIKNNKKYIFVFLFSLIIYEFVAWHITYGDTIASYGFSYAIAKGQVPYRDFNIISTPLYAILMSLGLNIWDNYLMFILEQCLLVTIFYYILDKLYGKKTIFIVLGIAMTGFYGLLPTYNFLCLLILTILIYLETKHSDNDYLIGFFIALAILSKHTVGCFLVLPTLILHYKNIKKILKRAIGALIPIIIFIIYLLVNNAFLDFINLSFGGLFDFANNNARTGIALFYISILMLIFSIILLFKDKKNPGNWYLIFSFFFLVPLFDLPHFSFYLICMIMMILPYLDFKNYSNYFIKLSSVISILFCILYILMFNKYNLVFMTKFDKFKYTLNSSDSYSMNLKVDKFLKKYDNSVIISYHKMFYDITNNNDLDYYDILLYGNFGYNGTNNMLNDIKNRKDTYFYVDMNSYNDDSSLSQFNKKIAKYIIDNYEYIESKYDFNVYYKK